MFSFFKSKPTKETQETAAYIAKTVSKELKDEIKALHLEISTKFREIEAQIQQVDAGVEVLDKKLAMKEHKDRQELGMVKYQLSQKGH